MTKTPRADHRHQGKDGGCSKNACLPRHAGKLAGNPQEYRGEWRWAFGSGFWRKK